MNNIWQQFYNTKFRLRMKFVFYEQKFHNYGMLNQKKLKAYIHKRVHILELNLCTKVFWNFIIKMSTFWNFTHKKQISKAHILELHIQKHFGLSHRSTFWNFTQQKSPHFTPKGHHFGFS